MKRLSWNSLLLAACILAASIYYWMGVPAVPFHPDESSQLFMSGDLETLFRDPAALFWRADGELDPHQRYREMDAPLTRSLLGAGRLVVGVPALPVDWNWSLSWQQNQAAGALPSERLLLSGRYAVVVLFPLTLLLLYLIGQRLGGTAAGWITLALAASNMLVLLHTRRAMAEGPLLFTTLLSLWMLVRSTRRPWLAAIPLALAFNAKQSAAALLIPALIVLLWQMDGNRASLRRKLAHLAAFGLLFGGITLALNPFVWNNPLPTIQAALQKRAEFTQLQYQDFATIGSPLAAPNLPARAVTLLSQLYIAPPAFLDSGNYAADTRAAVEAYLVNPLNDLLRGYGGGLLLLALGLFGMVLAVLEILRRPASPRRRTLLLVLVAGAAQFAALVVLLPVSFQRYAVILVPYACLWPGYGLGTLAGKVAAVFASRRKPAEQPSGATD